MMKQFIVILITLTLLGLVGCYNKTEPTAPPVTKFEPIDFGSNPQGAILKIYSGTSGIKEYEAHAPCRFTPTSEGQYLYAFCLGGYLTQHGTFNYRTSQINVMLESAAPLVTTWGQISGPDTVDQNSQVGFWLESNAYYAVVGDIGLVPANGQFTVNFGTESQKTIIVILFGQEQHPRVISKTVYVRGGTPPPTGFMKIIGPSQTVKGQSFNIRLSSQNIAAGSGFLSGAGTASGPTVINGDFTIATTLYHTSTIVYLGIGLDGQQVQDTLRVTVAGDPEPPAPTIKLTANCVNITNGQSVLLTTNSTNADYVLISSSVRPTVYLNPGFDTVRVWPQQSGVWRARVFGDGGTAESQLTITVAGAPEDSLWATLTIQPDTVLVGNKATVTWKSNAPKVVIDKFGEVTSEGYREVYPAMAGSEIYKLEAKNSSGQTRVTKTAKLVAKEVNVSWSFDFTLTDTIIRGNQATACWSSTGLDEVVISGYPGFGSTTTSGCQSFGPEATVTLVAEGKLGGTVKKRINQTCVVVDPPPTVTTGSCSVNPDTIFQGQKITLSWVSQNVDRIICDQLGELTAQGTRDIWPNSSGRKVFRFEFWKNSVVAKRDSCSALVLPPPPGNPQVDIWVDPDTTVQGWTINMSWTSQDVSEVFIDQFGLVPATGTRTLTLSQTTKFRITGKVQGITAARDSIIAYTVPALGAINLLAPANNTVDVSLTPTLKWQTTANATNYHLFIYDAVSGALILNVPNLGTQYHLTDSLDWSRQYSWRVEASNRWETKSSILWRFTTVAAIVEEPITLNITAEPSSIVKGDSTLVIWISQYADSVTIKQFGLVKLNGNRWDKPTVTTWYVAYAWRHGAIAVTDSARCEVNLPQPQVLEMILDKKCVEPYKQVKLTHDGGLSDFTLPEHIGPIKVDIQIKYKGDSSPNRDESAGFAIVVGNDTTFIERPSESCPVVYDDSTLTGEYWRYVGTVESPNTFRLLMRHAKGMSCYTPFHYDWSVVQVGLEPEVTQGKIRFTYTPTLLAMLQKTKR